ncbi:hypothetical protein BDQ17DRAFT_1334550 [Cyathus striatus]|nr:hypothetical protein BDQ17DRAFT_1334550 [Cyathus striatus]
MDKWISIIITKGKLNVLSLITCNLLVLVTYLYRVFWSTGETCIESAEETPRRPTEEQCTQLPVPSISIASLGPTGISNTSSIGGSYVSDTTSSSFFTLTTVEVDTSNFDLSSAASFVRHSISVVSGFCDVPEY